MTITTLAPEMLFILRDFPLLPAPVGSELAWLS